MQHTQLTIGRLAKAADVGIETIRYYQRRNLLPTPAVTQGAFRYYSPDVIDRIRFIKRAQELGFSLDDIAGLLQLADGRNRRAIRGIAKTRLESIRDKITDLKRMETVLSHLVHECEHSGMAASCPIIACLSGGDQLHSAGH